MTRRAPEFRPRRTRAEETRRRSRQRLAVAGSAAVLLVALVAVVLLVALSGNGGGSTPSGATSGINPGPEPRVEGPASRYIVQLTDLQAAPVHALPPQTFTLSPLAFGSLGYFTTGEEGERQVREWGYSSGYLSTLEPDGQLAAVLNGAYYVRTESVLFDTVDGARQAFGYLKDHHDRQQGSVKAASSAVGNEWAAYSFVSGTVGTSDKVMVYYRYLFRRGNMVSIVQVNGAQEFMEIERARALAAVIDQKALGQRVAPTPTPAATQAPIVVPPSPTQTP
jgi:hypothetical protein